MTNDGYSKITCRRKKRYANYGQAKDAKQRMAVRGCDVTVLDVYACPCSGESKHYHLGNAGSPVRRRVLAKRAARLAGAVQ